MKYSATALLAVAGLASAQTKQCTGTAVEEGGNWFCGKVSQIKYEGFVNSGSYEGVTSMGTDGSCGREKVSWDGPLGPFGEELSIHVRGPVNLKEFGVYTIDSAKEKRASTPSPHVHARRHGHQHLHQRRKREEWITATIDGQVVSWVNNYGVQPTQAPEAPPVVPEPAPKPKAIKEKPVVQAASTTSNDEEEEEEDNNTPAGAWARTSYYSAKDGVSKNLVFLGNYGGSGSGVFDNVFGNSLSYLNANGDGGSSSAETLKDVTLPSNKEFAIFTAEQCDGSSGFARASDVAYKGFGGNNKVFLFKFSMPHDASGASGFNGDMPAIWALNARIPRTQQYGDCSCWGSGCGEFDIYEVLAKGDTKCKSTIHLKGNDGGSSDYFERPVGGHISVAAVFDERSGSLAIKKLADDFNFADSLDDETVRGWIGEAEESSLFQLSAK